MNLRPYFFLCLLSLTITGSAAAAPSSPPDLYLARCAATPSVAHGRDSYPGAARIISSNKLVLPAGKSILAHGQIVSLAGRVLDENCVPISDAVVEIWQANTQGRYVIATPAERANPYPSFAGSGRAVTDNLGRYEFVTIFPGPYDNRAPHIHFRVVHNDFPALHTEMFFASDRRNETDPELKRLDAPLRSRLMAQITPRINNHPEAGLEGYFDITLKGRNKYRKF